jgi:hypothetical protein
MPEPGQKIDNPITGEHIVFKRTSRETAGECVLMDVSLRPAGVIAGAPHHHPHTEIFRVREGRLSGWIAGRGFVSYGAGEEFVVPSLVDHLVFNGASGWSRAEVEARPGGDFDRLLETAFELASGRKPRGLPRRVGVAELARLMVEQHVMVTLVPDSWQEALLSRVARAGGAARPVEAPPAAA